MHIRNLVLGLAASGCLASPLQGQDARAGRSAAPSSSSLGAPFRPEPHPDLPASNCAPHREAGPRSRLCRASPVPVRGPRTPVSASLLRGDLAQILSRANHSLVEIAEGRGLANGIYRSRTEVYASRFSAFPGDQCQAIYTFLRGSAGGRWAFGSASLSCTKPARSVDQANSEAEAVASRFLQADPRSGWRNIRDLRSPVQSAISYKFEIGGRTVIVEPTGHDNISRFSIHMTPRRVADDFEL